MKTRTKLFLLSIDGYTHNMTKEQLKQWAREVVSSHLIGSEDYTKSVYEDVKEQFKDCNESINEILLENIEEVKRILKKDYKK